MNLPNVAEEVKCKFTLEGFMASLGDLDLFSLVGYDGGDGTLGLIFASSAVLGGILFLLWFALIMIGGITADVFDGLFGTDFDGVGSLLKLDYINDELIIKNVTGNAGQSPAIAGSNNRAINLQDVQLTGAPAIDFDYSSGILTDITLSGEGIGTGLISHHGRFSDNIVLSNVKITGYNVGVDLHADDVDAVSRLSMFAITIKNSLLGH